MFLCIYNLFLANNTPTELVESKHPFPLKQYCYWKILICKEKNNCQVQNNFLGTLCKNSDSWCQLLTSFVSQ